MIAAFTCADCGRIFSHPTGLGQHRRHVRRRGVHTPFKKPRRPRPVVSLAEYLDARTSPEPMSGCWLWTGCANALGYGVCMLRGRRLAHRAWWAHANGLADVPRGLVVRHRCDNPACVNPQHLETGSMADNPADMVARGRSRRGERNPLSRLTTEAVLAIRSAVASGYTRTAVAGCFGLSHQHVSELVRGLRWGHV